MGQLPVGRRCIGRRAAATIFWEVVGGGWGMGSGVFMNLPQWSSLAKEYTHIHPLRVVFRTLL